MTYVIQQIENQNPNNATTLKSTTNGSMFSVTFGKVGGILSPPPPTTPYNSVGQFPGVCVREKGFPKENRPP